LRYQTFYRSPSRPPYRFGSDAFLRRFEPALLCAQKLDARGLDGFRIDCGAESLHRLRG
jgi:hypothetical protein